MVKLDRIEHIIELPEGVSLKSIPHLVRVLS